jgi:hypothetical protein
VRWLLAEHVELYRSPSMVSGGEVNDVLEEMALPPGIASRPPSELELSDPQVSLNVIWSRRVVAGRKRRSTQRLARTQKMRERQSYRRGVNQVVDATESLAS